ncbi:MAG: Dps family protein [Candidatus Nitrosotenuis sp.]
MDINIGIKESDRRAVATGLCRLLANTNTLYLKTHNYHWNVRGPMFQTLHVLFETQYNELWLAGDLIAERIRALGEFAPGSYSIYSKLTSISTEDDDRFLSSDTMLKNLVYGHEAIVKIAREIMPTAVQAGDDVSVDLLTQRMEVSEKAAWMLRSLLG